MRDVHKKFHMLSYSLVTSEEKVNHTGRITVIDILKHKRF